MDVLDVTELNSKCNFNDDCEAVADSFHLRPLQSTFDLYFSLDCTHPFLIMSMYYFGTTFIPKHTVVP